MIRYATRLPPNSSTSLLPNGLVRKIEYFGTEGSIEFMAALLEHLIKKPDPMIVPINDYAILSNRKHHYSISYDMMRCGILEEDERRFVDCVGEAWDVHGKELWTKVAEGACGAFAAALSSYREEQPKLADFLTKVVNEDRY